MTDGGDGLADTLKNFAEEAKGGKGDNDGDEVNDPDKAKNGPDIFLVGTKTELRGGAEEKRNFPKRRNKAREGDERRRLPGVLNSRKCPLRDPSVQGRCQMCAKVQKRKKVISVTIYHLKL